MLEEAKKNPASPFKADAKFTELDATTARFDERGIADPLIGSVHDPIYQGAGAMGVAGIPQPKPGAVTKAHGGMLFIDEIGELHSIQMNKLLKVLEDRKVFWKVRTITRKTRILLLISTIFSKMGCLPIFVLSERQHVPHELPPALRSRCMEVYFRPLLPEEIGKIAEDAVEKIGFSPCPDAVDVVKRYATNGRRRSTSFSWLLDLHSLKSVRHSRLLMSSGSREAVRSSQGRIVRFLQAAGRFCEWTRRLRTQYGYDFGD